MRGLANHRSVHDVRGLSRILWRTGTRPFWHGGAASSCSCASSSGGGAASSGSCTTASGCACCDTATHSGLTWRGGGTWRSAAAGVRNWHGARLGGIVGNEVIEQWWYRWTLAARTSDSCIDALPFVSSLNKVLHALTSFDVKIGVFSNASNCNMGMEDALATFHSRSERRKLKK